jgi:hypothetical protein
VTAVSNPSVESQLGASSSITLRLPGWELFTKDVGLNYGRPQFVQDIRWGVS